CGKESMRSIPRTSSSSWKLAESRLTAADQVAPPSVDREQPMLLVTTPPFTLPTAHTTYAVEAALVAPGRKRGTDPCTSNVADPVWSVAAGDQVVPRLSVKLVRILALLPALGKSVQEMRRRPVLRLTSMNS